MTKIIIFITTAIIVCLMILFLLIVINRKKFNEPQTNNEDDWKNFIFGNMKFFEKKFFWIKLVIWVIAYLMDRYNPHSYYLLLGLIVYILLEIETQILTFQFAKKKIALGK